VTLGTPFSGSHTSTNAWRLFELTSGKDITKELQQFDLPAAPRPHDLDFFTHRWRGGLARKHSEAQQSQSQNRKH